MMNDEWRMMKDDEGWMENDEGWRINDEGWWFQAVEGFWLQVIGNSVEKVFVKKQAEKIKSCKID